MIILGIDPGTATTGYGIIQTKNKRRGTKNLRCINFGCVETNKDLDFSKRLLFLSKEIRKITKDYQPELAAIETLFFFQNKKTAIKVSQAIGVILLTLEKMKIPIVEYSPLEVKKFLTKNGWAKKDDIQKRVKKVLKLKEPLKPDDIADALALAIYAAHKL